MIQVKLKHVKRKRDIKKKGKYFFLPLIFPSVIIVACCLDIWLCAILVFGDHTFSSALVKRLHVQP